MSEKIVLQPVIPLLTVEKVDKENIKEFGDFLRSYPELFPALLNVPIARMRQRKDSVYIPDSGQRDPNGRIIFQLGDYLVVSENGNRHFTNNKMIKHGIVEDIPREMFYPLEAIILPDAIPFV